MIRLERSRKTDDPVYLESRHIRIGLLEKDFRKIESGQEEIFKTKKPLIAMCHLLALPGDPAYDKTGGMKQVIDWAR